MGSSSPSHSGALPDSQSSELALTHPTDGECLKIWSNTSASWRDSLTVEAYLKESLFLTTIPLAKDGGMTHWILVDKTLPPDERAIFCSCETFRKRSLTSTENGVVSDNIVHGIASVFCPPPYRGRGYAARMMREISEVLRNWQSENTRCIGSILYSDIGKTYYSKLGWLPHVTNSHVVMQPSSPSIANSPRARPIPREGLAELCKSDEAMIRKAMAAPAEGTSMRMTIVPDLDHMLWHIDKEEFACNFLFGKIPQAKGAIVGPAGSRVWAVWTRRYYGKPDSASPNNTLYILRLVIENEDTVDNDRVNYLKAVLEAAQEQAAEWRLDQVKLWDPTPEVQELIRNAGIEHSIVERQEESIASGLWYDENAGTAPAPQWMNNEHYSWC